MHVLLNARHLECSVDADTGAHALYAQSVKLSVGNNLYGWSPHSETPTDTPVTSRKPEASGSARHGILYTQTA